MVSININRIRKEAEQVRNKSRAMQQQLGSADAPKTHIKAWEDMELLSSNVLACIMDDEFSMDKFTPTFMQYVGLKSRLSIA